MQAFNIVSPIKMAVKIVALVLTLGLCVQGLIAMYTEIMVAF